MYPSYNPTCSALHYDDKLDAVGLIEGPPSLLVEVRVPEVPAQRVQQPEVVTENARKLLLFPAQRAQQPEVVTAHAGKLLLIFIPGTGSFYCT